MAKKKGALVCVDNSIMTATFQNPLELGADISMVSAKFIAGHSDVIGGLLSARKGLRVSQTRLLFSKTPAARF